MVNFGRGSSIGFKTIESWYFLLNDLITSDKTVFLKYIFPFFQAKTALESICSFLNLLIYAALRDLRFNQDRGYYFIYTLDGVVNLYPPDPSLETKHYTDAFPPEGQDSIRQIITLLHNQQEGFVSYQWLLPDGKKSLNKYSYLKLFKPYNLVIGTGDYLELFEKQLKDEVYQRIANIYFGPDKEGYYFINSYDGDLYVTNGEYHAGQKNIWDTVDARGTKVVQENSRLAQQHPEGTFSTYVWEKNSGEESEKVSFILGVDEWKIFIGTGFYTDTVKNKIALHVDARKKEFEQGVFDTLKIILVTMAIIGFLLYFMMRKLSQNLKVFRSNLEKSVERVFK